MLPSGAVDARGAPGLYAPAQGLILAHSATVSSPRTPIAYDCVKLIVVRHGSAVLLSKFGEKPVKIGDVVVLPADTLCGSQPEGAVTVTTIQLDRDYVVDTAPVSRAREKWSDNAAGAIWDASIVKMVGDLGGDERPPRTRALPRPPRSTTTTSRAPSTAASAGPGSSCPPPRTVTATSTATSFAQAGTPSAPTAPGKRCSSTTWRN